MTKQVYNAKVDGCRSRGRPRYTFHDQIDRVLAEGAVRSLKNRQACMTRVMNEKANEVCKNKPKWRSKEDAEAIRQDISSVLRRSRLPKPNLTRAEYIALKNIRNKPEITVLRADKGNATVVMDTSDYNSKIQDLLSDESTYKKVKTDPTDKVTKQTIAVMKKHSEKLSLDVSALTPSCAKAPKLYGLPKIHKNNIHPNEP
ncbi:hypothetical protein K1T71_008132 [Dendrolimus kikuchii]|uniref:Uncharacterized protein n=1 Tax=Dendrolimus kikuchii TaxID=765133 RepID=A0ACC1CWD0_9NEOP|nr:hypothetical protein K1T71_008132 [Dendrolimus kikuchii]